MNNLINTPDNFSFTNEISLNNDRTACNPFNANNNMGNYFKQCQEESQSPLWGSFKPVRENCPGGDPKVGTPCHNIWNNQTRRKGVVFKFSLN